jgi:ribosomal protein L22
VVVERKKEKQKTPAELAAEQTKRDKQEGAGEDKPKRSRKPREEEKAQPASNAKPKAVEGSGQVEQKEAEEKPQKEPEKQPARSRPRSEGAAAKKRPARRRQAPEPARPPAARPVVRAQAKYVRSSARKARLVIEHIRGKSVEDARAVLRHTPRAIARDIERLLASAVANAENNHELVGDDLYVKEAFADEGPTLKRFRPRALGRATRIRKRTSHLTLTLTPRE